ncbi:MAG: hypothetical protein GX564_13795 [Oligosphaeraceae bacterium]|nr:hypothetical protein [Oligosphaeraceae bacterium]
MKQNFYLTIFPMEALIASELEPAAFGSYMAVGARKGSAEALMFIQLKDTRGPFDWDSARAACIEHADGRPKHSYYLSIYRVLENLPLDILGSVYLVTRDGRTLELALAERSVYADTIDRSWSSIGLYKELCPVFPLVVSRRKPAEFGAYLTAPTSRTRVPALVFTDLRICENLEEYLTGGNIGNNVYDRHPEHLVNCINQVREHPEKGAKIVDRTYFAHFSYSLIKNGVFLSKQDETLFWPLPSVARIKEIDYDWGRSADMY